MSERFEFWVNLIFKTALFFLLFLNAPAGLGNQKDFQEDNLRIVGVQLNDLTPIDEALTIYPHLNDWWIPLEKLSDDLGFAIQTSAKTEFAEGFIISESNRFFLDIKNCVVEISKSKMKYPCETVFIHQEEVYVLLSVLAGWFPVEIHVEPLRSLMIVKPNEKLPLQLRRNRESIMGNLFATSDNTNPKFPVESMNSSVFSGPTLDESITAVYGRTNENQPFQLIHSTGFGGEVIGLNLTGFVQGRLNSLDGWRMQFTKEDRENRLMGPLAIRKIQFLDVDTPPIPLLAEGGTGKGILFSSFRLDKPSVYDKQDFFGVLLPGWEVLLYRNDILINRQTSNPSGTYRFTSVPLLFGRNTFKLVFFGPHGEAREEQRVLNITSDFIVPGENQYWFGLLMARPTETINTYKQRAMFNLLHGLSQNISLGVGFLQEKESNYSLGVIQLLGSNRLFNFAMNSAISNFGGKAFEWSGQTRFLGLDLNAKYAKYLNFQSPAIDQTTMPLDNFLNASLQYIIPSYPAVGLNFAYEAKYLTNGSNTKVLKQNLSSQLGMIGVSNELDYFFDSSNQIQGRFDIGGFFSFYRSRATLNYSFEKLLSLGGDLSFLIGKNSNAVFVTKWDLNSELANYGLSFTKAFKEANLSLDLGYASSGSFNFGITLSFSMVRDPQTQAFQFISTPQVMEGEASIQVCIDMDRNGKCEPSDPPLRQIHLSLNGRDTETMTDDTGRAFLSGLSPNQPYDLTIKFSELNNPDLKLAKTGIRFYPQASKVFLATLPVVYVGAIEGKVEIISLKTSKGAKRLEVSLYSNTDTLVATTKTDRDGIYVFEDLPPGKYYVKLKSTQDVERVEISDQGGYVLGVNFKINK